MIQFIGDRLVKYVINQTRLAGTGNAGNAAENTQWNISGDVLQIICACAGDSNFF